MSPCIIRFSFLPLLCTIIFFSCKKQREKTSPRIENISESVYASGIVKSKNQYQVFSTTSGILSKLLVSENDLVKKGTPIAILSNETSKLSADNALLAANYSDLNANREKLTDLKNSISLAESKYLNDSVLFKRQQNLWEQGIGTRLELEQKELNYKNAKFAVESARIKYNDLVRQLKFNAAQSRNNFVISKKNESDFTIKSEIDGKIYSIYREQGEIVNQQVPLALIGDAGSFLMELQVDEYDIARIRGGQKILVIMDSYKGKVFEATVTKIYPAMNEHSKSFSVEAVFTNQPPQLFPNLTVEANIIIQTKQNALLIPRSYLVSDSFVLVEKNKKRPVVTGLKDYRNVEIIDGISPQDVIYKPEE